MLLRVRWQVLLVRAVPNRLNPPADAHQEPTSHSPVVASSVARPGVDVHGFPFAPEAGPPPPENNLYRHDSHASRQTPHQFSDYGREPASTTFPASVQGSGQVSSVHT